MSSNAIFLLLASTYALLPVPDKSRRHRNFFSEEKESTNEMMVNRIFFGCMSTVISENDNNGWPYMAVASGLELSTTATASRPRK